MPSWSVTGDARLANGWVSRIFPYCGVGGTCLGGCQVQQVGLATHPGPLVGSSGREYKQGGDQHLSEQVRRQEVTAQGGSYRQRSKSRCHGDHMVRSAIGIVSPEGPDNRPAAPSAKSYQASPPISPSPDRWINTTR